MSIPVAAVSKQQYALVQHSEVLRNVLQALEQNSINLQSPLELRLSKYGARVWVIIPVPDYQFAPRSRHPLVLKVHCFNSVDRSFAVRVQLAWHRDLSKDGNGLLWPEEFRRNHDQSFKSEEIEEFLTDQFDERLPKVIAQYRRLFKTRPCQGSLEDWIKDWIDGIVTDKWGYETAARILSLLLYGSDCRVVDNRKKAEVKTHARKVEQQNRNKLDDLLGVSSAENAYDISQVLGLLANEHKAIESQLKRLGQVSALIDALLKQEKRRNRRLA